MLCLYRKTSKPNCRLTGGSVRFHAVVIVKNKRNRLEPPVNRRLGFEVVPYTLISTNTGKHQKKYTSGPRYWKVPVLVNTGTVLLYQYCRKMWYLRSLEHASVIQKLTILEYKNGLVLSNTCVPVSGTWSILFPVLLSLLLHHKHELHGQDLHTVQVLHVVVTVPAICDPTPANEALCGKINFELWANM